MANEKRLIDANALTDEIIFVKKCLASEDKAGEWANGYRSGLIASLEEIGLQPTVDAVEVVRGEWIEDYETFTDDSGQESYPVQTGYVCSECGVDGSPFWRYCPYCGAYMGRME